MAGCAARNIEYAGLDDALRRQRQAYAGVAVPMIDFDVFARKGLEPEPPDQQSVFHVIAKSLGGCHDSDRCEPGAWTRTPRCNSGAITVGGMERYLLAGMGRILARPQSCWSPPAPRSFCCSRCFPASPRSSRSTASSPIRDGRRPHRLSGRRAAQRGLDLSSAASGPCRARTTAALSFGFFFGLAIALWSANSGIKTLFEAMNIAYDEDEKRSFLGLNLLSLASRWAPY